MSKSVLFVVLGLVLVINGCAGFLPRPAINRFPAQINNEAFNLAFTFPLSEELSQADYTEFVTDTIESYTPDPEGTPGFRFEFIESYTLKKSLAYQIEFDLDPKSGQYIYRIFHSLLALKDRVATQSMIDFFNNQGKTIRTADRKAYLEMYQDAKNGNPIALDAFLKMRRLQGDMSTGLEGDIYQTEDYQKTLTLINNMREQMSDDIKKFKSPNTKPSKLETSPRHH